MYVISVVILRGVGAGVASFIALESRKYIVKSGQIRAVFYKLNFLFF